MKVWLTVSLAILVWASGLRAGAESDKEVEAHKAVLDLAGAFTNDGFKMRDGHWVGTIKPHEVKGPRPDFRRRAAVSIIFRSVYSKGTRVVFAWSTPTNKLHRNELSFKLRGYGIRSSESPSGVVLFSNHIRERLRPIHFDGGSKAPGQAIRGDR